MILRKVLAIGLMMLVGFAPHAAVAADLKLRTWYKSCEGTACVILFKVADKVTLMVRVDPKAKQPNILAVRFFPDADIVKGMTWEMGGAPPINVPFLACIPNDKPATCVAQVTATDKQLAQIMGHSTFSFSGARKGRTLSYEVPLAKFSAVNAGPSTVGNAELSAFIR